MKLFSEPCLKNGIDLYKVMEEELKERLQDFNDIDQSLDFLVKNVIELENEVIERKESDALLSRIKDFRDGIGVLESLKLSIKANRETFEKQLSYGEQNGTDWDVEEIEGLEDQAKTYIDVIIESLETLNPVKTSVEALQQKVRKIKEDPDKYGVKFTQIMESIYRNINDVKLRMSQVSDNINKSVKQGMMNKVIMTHSVLKANKEFLKKEGNKR